MINKIEVINARNRSKKRSGLWNYLKQHIFIMINMLIRIYSLFDSMSAKTYVLQYYFTWVNYVGKVCVLTIHTRLTRRHIVIWIMIYALQTVHIYIIPRESSCLNTQHTLRSLSQIKRALLEMSRLFFLFCVRMWPILCLSAQSMVPLRKKIWL